MGRYIQQSDLENVFGSDNIVVWSNLDNSTDSANTTRINAAISYAEEDVENRFRDGRYTVPFVGASGSIPKVIVDWMAKIAGAWLYESRPQKFTEDENSEEINFGRIRRHVDTDIKLYVSGQRRVNLALAERSTPSAPIVL